MNIKQIVTLFLFLFFTFLLQAQTAKKNPTAKLKVNVVNTLGNIVKNANVTLYKTEEDYRNSQNAVTSMKTNEKGFVKFKKIAPIVYYVDVRYQELKNDGEGVVIPELKPRRTNKVLIIIK